MPAHEHVLRQNMPKGQSRPKELRNKNLELELIVQSCSRE